LSNYSKNSVWGLIIISAIIFAITMGVRQSLGLFIAPINSSLGLDIVSISFALAVGQFMWGLAQPIFGAIADKKGSLGVLIIGALMMFIGLVLTPFVKTDWGLVLTLGILSAAGAGAGSFSILIGATAKQMPVEKRAFAGGFINAGGSFGQFVFAPLAQSIINGFGWMYAMFTMAITTLFTIPLAYLLGAKKEKKVIEENKSTTDEIKLKQQIFEAFKNKNYLYLHAGFFTCGFHIAFLITHLPGEVAMCGHSASVSATALALIGFFNIFGSLYAGYLGSKYKMKYILAILYASRALMIFIYLISPKTELNFYIFSAFLGLTWLATVPPTAGLVGKFFGTKYLATLFGLTLLTHQIGGFLGAWMGGLFIKYTGDYSSMWYLDILLALLAAIVNLLIEEDDLKKV
jgi:MFS family permease